MVFEKALSYILNTFLGDFVENLDENQLNVGIWGGDVELKNLVLKPSVLDDLDLPIQTVYGSLGKLILKIPWKSLYTSPTIIIVEDIYLLAEPNQQVKYDPVKEEKNRYEAKKKDIKKVEDAKKAEAEKDKPKADATFVEKLITNIIKNVQLTVRHIHIRYEDKVTHPRSPFALGITLSDLIVESTDSNWKKAIVEDISKIYKIVQLEGLSVYWNSGCTLYGSLPTVDMIYRMRKEIASKNTQPDGYAYVLGPINSSARLRMNQKPENDSPAFSIPKIHLNLDMEKLFIGISKAQYRDIIALADSMGRMSKGVPYRKYRPNLDSYKGHYKEWWHFAYQCILETHVRRRKRDWDWNNILKYRKMCKEYGDLYKKLIKKSSKPEDKKRLEECEKVLDLTNIVIIRQRIELEIERLMKTQKATEKQSWFGWVWTSASKAGVDDMKKGAQILKQFESELTPEEKAKLYKAIDYQENAGPAVYPQAYVDNSSTFLLRMLEVQLRDDDNKVKVILHTDLKGVKCKLETRPAASGLEVHVKIDDFVTLGMRQDDFVPQLVTSESVQKSKGLLEVSFETNPLDGKCDQRVKVVAQPLKIVYDALTINKIVEIFTVPADTTLDQIQAAAGSGLTNVKAMTSTGLQYAIEKHVRLDLDVDFQAPLIIIPHGGKYTGTENVLVANLGRLKAYSYGKRSSSADVRNLYEQGIDQEDIFKLMMKHAYDNFRLELTNLQILMAQSDEEWKEPIKNSETSEMHLLNPLSLNITYSKCLIVDDPRLPLSKAAGELPSIVVNVSEARLLLLVGLGSSIPLPTPDVPELQPLSKTKAGSSMMLAKYKELQESAKLTKHKLVLPEDSERNFVQFTTMEAKFVMTELSVRISQQETIHADTTELASFTVKSLECDLVQQTFNTSVSLLLGGITLEQNRGDQTIHIISTPPSKSGEDYLFKVKFVQVDPKSPELHSVHKSCETMLNLDFGVLSVILHQEGLLALIQFSTIVQDRIALETNERQVDRIATTAPKRKLSVIGEQMVDTHKSVAKIKKKKSHLIVETIKFKLRADLQEVNVEFATDNSKISSCAIRGITSEIIVKNTYTQVDTKLEEICVVDLNPDTLHTLILAGTEGVALTTQIVLNNLDAESEKPDIDVTVKMGGMRIIFLNWFVTNMLNFLNQFQTAQQKIIEASQAAAQTAKENMKDVYQKATKISLNINLKAPDILVPVDSQSYDALLLDLGTLSLSNRFTTLDAKNEEGFSAVVDDLKVSLSNLTVVRIKMDHKNEIIKQCPLLEPVNFDIRVKRNLSVGWYTSIPDIDLSGKIKTIKLLLSQADYQMIMSILSGNLAEGQPEKVIEPTKSMQSTQEEVLAVVNIESTVQIAGDLWKSTIETKPHVFLKLTFTMEELIINLYSGGAKSLTMDSPCHEASSHLARFSLEGLAIKGRILTDQSIVMSILLINCLLDDMRKGREDKLNRLIERTQTDPELSGSASSSSETVAPVKSMVDVTFQQNGNDMFADVRIFSFTLILSVDYLLKIADFFNNPDQPETQNKQTQTKSTTTISRQSRSKMTVATAASTAPEKETRMTINLKLEKPDIILVEHMDNINTNAMILNSEILVKLRIAGPHQVINGTIKDLQLYRCNYNPALRADTKSHVLYPVTISLAGSTPQSKGLHLELLVTDVRLSVSPATIEQLNRILVTMSSPGTSQEEDTEETFNYAKIWDPTPFSSPDYWFLKTEYALEAIEGPEGWESPDKLLRPTLQELCIIAVPSIVITVEAGVGNKTLPMLLLETGLKGSARNWSSQLSVEAGLTLQMGYYNSRLALWEPLIEPVEVFKDNRGVFVPWELKLEVAMNEQDETLNATSPTSESDNEPSQAQPVMSIDVSSENSLELTVTKTCLEVLQNLGKAFANAMKSDTIRHVAALEAPFKVLNEIGEDITILLEKSSFVIAEGGSLEDINRSAAVPLQLKPESSDSKKLQLGKELLANSQQRDRFLHVMVNNKNCELALPVVRADKRFFMLNYRGDGDNWGIISDVKVDEGVTIITLRSILQVHNHFSVAIDVYYMTLKGNELELIGVVQSGGFLNIPLKAVYTPTNELFFAVSGYAISKSPYIWKDLQINLTITKMLHCPQKNTEKGNEPFIIKAIGEIEQVYYENTSRHTMASACYNIHLRPAVVFKNCLPLDIICCVDEQAEEFTVKTGDTLQLPNVDPGKNVLVIRIPEYLEKEWSCRQEIVTEPQEFAVWTFHSYDSPTKVSVDLGIHTLNKNGSLIMSLYCPFWMLNKTGLMIGYRKSRKTEKHEAAGSPAKSTDESLNVLHHPAHFKGPILFSFSARNFFGKKKASIRVESGEWSDKFSLDVAGSSGVVTCKVNDRNYQIGVHNQLTYNSLTKQVTFTPFYVIINAASYTIQCQESDRPADHWITVEPKSCTALWPRSELEDKLLKLRVADTDDITAPFLYTESHNTLLRLNNKYGGINVDIQLTEGAVYINLAPYQEGSAPALLVNHTDTSISYWEKNSVQKRSLLPKHSVLYTWENPSGPRIIVWDRGSKKEIVNDLRKDSCGEFNLTENQNICWASFLDGMQRVLLFTEDKAIAEGAQASNLFEVIQQDITVSIHGVGLSLVNNINRQEIVYVGIASSGIIWETCKLNAKRYKPLSTKESNQLEVAYQHYLLRLNSEMEEELGRSVIDGKMEVDFKTGIMTKPNKRKIRRTFQTGLWLQMKSSPSQMQLHAKINRLQIDNQMFDCTFPVVLAPVPPPKSVAADSGIKPFVEVSIVELLQKNSQIRQYKYFKVLVQEFHIKVDLGFINAIVDLFQQSEGTDEEERELFLKDTKLVDEPLYSLASTQSIQEQKSFYDLLHFSPLKIHISFSMAAGTTAGQNAATPNFLNVLLQGLGVTLTDLQDVVFKLSYFERDYTFLTQKQLVNEATTHYVGQSVKQLYVLVLGLDVIGNPYGLVLGITKGVEDLFYEPFQGAIQGPGEFAEGLALGVKSLFGHTVGGAAGAMSRITGAMGKGIAALTFDENYQRKRRDQLNKKPATVQEGIARSGKGLVMGVYSGVTGVFTKPVAGAREQGVEGFFKGLGKGAVGLVTRPVAGVVDFASGSLDVVKRAAECGAEDATRLRSPRFLQSDGLVRPYNKQEAEGHKLLSELSKGKYAGTDVYVAHYTVIEKKEMLLLTDKRLAYIAHNDIFGGWQIEWSYTWDEIKQPPKVVPKGVLIITSEKKKKLFSSSDSGKTVIIPDPAVKEDICIKIESLRGA